MEYTAYELLWFFLVYAFLGWVAETVLAAAKRRRLINRGFLNLPLSPVYGLAAVLFSVFLPELRSAPFFLFLFGMVIATALELFTSVFLQKLTGERWWDYSNHRFQFEGYISLTYAIVWGISALLCIFVGNPILAALTDLIPRQIGDIILLASYILLAVDMTASFAALFQLGKSVREPSELSRLLRRLTDALDNAVTRAVQRRVARAYPGLDREHLREKAAAKTPPERDNVFAKGCGFHKMVYLFLIAAFLGDIIETIFCRLTTGVWMSRSSLVWGPFSIVWGFGAVLLTAVLYKYRDRSDRYVFLVGTVAGGAYEYICSVLSELVFGTVFWDYSHLPFNLGGRINLLYCFFWGIAAVVWLKGIYPRLSGWIEKLPMSVGRAGTWIIVVFMLVNMAASALALARYTERVTTGAPAENALETLLDQRFPNERMERVYPNAILVED